MDIQYIQMIINSFHSVLESVVSSPVVRSEIRQNQQESGSRDILVMIGIVGDVDGQVYMSMDSQAGRSLASQMLGGIEIDDPELTVSAVSELCNMVVGNACSSMSDTNTRIDMMPPAIVTHITSGAGQNQLYAISFFLDKLGNVDLDMLMKATG